MLLSPKENRLVRFFGISLRRSRAGALRLVRDLLFGCPPNRHPSPDCWAPSCLASSFFLLICTAQSSSGTWSFSLLLPRFLFFFLSFCSRYPRQPSRCCLLSEECRHTDFRFVIRKSLDRREHTLDALCLPGSSLSVVCSGLGCHTGESSSGVTDKGSGPPTKANKRLRIRSAILRISIYFQMVYLLFL